MKKRIASNCVEVSRHGDLTTIVTHRSRCVRNIENRILTITDAVAHPDLVLGVTGLVWTLSKLKLATPRAVTVDVAASFLVGLGVFWFVTRSYG